MLERKTCFPIPYLDSIDLPLAVYRFSLEQAFAKFGSKNRRRRALTDKLTKIFNTELSTGHLAQVVVSGSFTNAKTETNYIDTFLMVDDEFEVTYKKRMGASFDFHFIPDEVHKTQIGRPHLALQN